MATSQRHATCATCARTYPAYGGIIDFRVGGAAWIDIDDDRDLAVELLAEPDSTAERLAMLVFSRRPEWSEERALRQTRRVISAADHLVHDVDGWLAPVFAGKGAVLDLGCGPGALVAAACRRGHLVIGVDVSLAWLVVARALIAEHGGTPVLAAAFGEALPIADDALTGTVSLDVIEHVSDRERYVGELVRVLAPDGCAALSTPNRFSLAAEPHVGVWGVGWLPRQWQRSYAERRSGLHYGSTWLLGLGELTRLLARTGRLQFHVEAPAVPLTTLARSTRRRAFLARLYNSCVPSPLFQQVALWFGPFFHVIAYKRLSR
ncbi:MAG TPA: class I SAM-dependent methyltransferase [Vicinamibacterales bacterium]|nr:class I SAM-dependent methyltransferase [Vicinamibacterales bacterium]